MFQEVCCGCKQEWSAGIVADQRGELDPEDLDLVFQGIHPLEGSVQQIAHVHLGGLVGRLGEGQRLLLLRALDQGREVLVQPDQADLPCAAEGAPLVAAVLLPVVEAVWLAVARFGLPVRVEEVPA